MPAALPLSTEISQASQGETEYRILEVQYGNGYSQRALDGLNASMSSWNVSWENIPFAQFQALVAAFDAAYGIDYFTWQAPGDATTKKWIVQKWSRAAASGNYYSVSATLKQVFDI